MIKFWAKYITKYTEIKKLHTDIDKLTDKLFHTSFILSSERKRLYNALDEIHYKDTEIKKLREEVAHLTHVNKQLCLKYKPEFKLDKDGNVSIVDNYTKVSSGGKITNCLEPCQEKYDNWPNSICSECK